jgi:hypothetical protein
MSAEKDAPVVDEPVEATEDDELELIIEEEPAFAFSLIQDT